MIERQELHCHNCNQYVQFNLDLELNGKHILTCPKCGHKHYRYVYDGKISDRRWDQDPSQNNVYNVSPFTVTYTSTSTFSRYIGGSTFLYGAWMNLTTAT
jgi:DNA-directed RNA polymerase subunit RPC12/RpoP